LLLERLDRVVTNAGAWSGLDPLVVDPPSTQVPGACTDRSSTPWSRAVRGGNTIAMLDLDRGDLRPEHLRN